MSSRLRFPDVPIDGRVRHAHHFDPELAHGCSEHFHIERHIEACYHHHAAGHLISMDAECGFVRDETGAVRAIRG